MASLPEEPLGPDRWHGLLHDRGLDADGPEDVLRPVHDRAGHAARALRRDHTAPERHVDGLRRRASRAVPEGSAIPDLRR